MLVYVAAVALLVRIALATGHIGAILSRRWTSNAWDSISEKMAMTLRSQRPDVPSDTDTAHEQSETWAETVVLKQVGNELELQFGLRRAETLRLLRR